MDFQYQDTIRKKDMKIDWKNVKIGDRFMAIRSSLGPLGYATVTEKKDGRIIFSLTHLDDTPAMNLSVNPSCQGNPKCNGENCRACALTLGQMHLKYVDNVEK